MHLVCHREHIIEAIIITIIIKGDFVRRQNSSKITYCDYRAPSTTTPKLRNYNYAIRFRTGRKDCCKLGLYFGTILL